MCSTISYSTARVNNIAHHFDVFAFLERNPKNFECTLPIFWTNAFIYPFTNGTKTTPINGFVV